MEGEKPKSNGQTQQKGQSSRTLHLKSGAKKPSGPRDGTRDLEGQIARNQEELGVGKDHKTPDMVKKHRGTFP